METQHPYDDVTPLEIATKGKTLLIIDTLSQKPKTPTSLSDNNGLFPRSQRKNIGDYD